MAAGEISVPNPASCGFGPSTVSLWVEDRGGETTVASLILVLGTELVSYLELCNSNLMDFSKIVFLLAIRV